MKKILLSCACCLLAVGLLAGCDEDVEDVNPEEPDTTVPSTGGDDGDGNGETTYLFGFELDGTLQYIDGGLVEYNGAPQSNEGAYTDDVSKAAAISCEVSGSTYYLSFDNEGVTNWISIVSGDHPNLSYATEKSPIYLHTTDGGAEYFGDEAGDYFLSYNATYKCVYASSVSSWLTSSPVCGLYTTEGKLVAGGKGEEPAPAIEPVLGTVTTGQYFLGVTLNGVPYYFDGQVYSNNYAEVTSDGWDAVVVTVAEVTGGYTLSFSDESAATQYLNMTENNSNRNLKWGTEPFVWSYDTTYSVFVAQDSVGDWYFIGTYGTYVELTLNAYGYLTGDKSSSYTQYPAELFDVITYVAPTTITVSGETSVEVGGRITLTATPSIVGEDDVDPRVTWSSTEPTIATVSDAGVVRGVAVGSTSITATSVKDPTVSGSLSIDVVAASGETVVYKLGALDSANYTYRWFNGTANGSGLNTTTEWDEAAEVYIDAVESDLTNACTLSFYDSDDKLKYISNSGSTSATLSEDPCTWVWDETYQVFALGHTLSQASADRFLCFYATDNDFRAYAASSSNLNYPHVTAYTTQPANPERPEPTTVTISGLTNVEVGKTIHLTAEVAPEGALQDVTWESSDETKATIDDDGYVTGVAVTSGEEYVTITATSTAKTSVSGTYQITVSEAIQHTEVEIGTYDFTKKDSNYDDSVYDNGSKLGTNAYSTGDALKATFNAYWTGKNGYADPLSSITSTSYIYNYYTGNNTLHSGEHGLLKTGTSSNNGTINITVDKTITKVVIEQQSWSTSENCTITVNSVSKESASKGVQEPLTFDIEEATDLDMTFAKRCHIFSITLYGYVD